MAAAANGHTAADGPSAGASSSNGSKFKPVSDFNAEECQQLLEVLLELLSGGGVSGVHGGGQLMTLQNGVRAGSTVLQNEGRGSGGVGKGELQLTRTAGRSGGKSAIGSEPAVDPLHGAVSDSWHDSVVDLSRESSDEEEVVTSGREQQQQQGGRGKGNWKGGKPHDLSDTAAELHSAAVMRLKEALADLLVKAKSGAVHESAGAAVRGLSRGSGSGQKGAGLSTPLGKRGRRFQEAGDDDDADFQDAAGDVEQWELPAAAAAALEAYLQAAQQKQGKKQRQQSMNPGLSPLTAKLAAGMQLHTPGAKACPIYPTGSDGDPPDMYGSPDGGVGGGAGGLGGGAGAAVTPGGLASQLRKGAKLADTGQDRQGAAAGKDGDVLKSPGRKSKKGPVDPWGPSQRGQAAAALAASTKKRPKKKGLTKLELAEEEGNIGGQGGSCAAAVAAAVTHAKGGVAIGGNQRTQRLMQMVAPKATGSPAVTPKTAAAGRSRAVQKAPLGMSQAVNIQQQQQQDVPMASPRSSKRAGRGRAAGASANAAIMDDEVMLQDSHACTDSDAEEPAAVPVQQAEPSMEQQTQQLAEQHGASVSWALSQLLVQAVPMLMSEWALAPPAGAAAFVWDDVQVLQSRLAPQTRQELADALGQPWEQLPGCLREMDGSWEDVCVGYKLLQTYPGDGVPIGEWFGLFCSTVGLAVGPGANKEEEGTKGPKRQRGR